MGRGGPADDVRSVLRALVSIRQHYLFHDTPARRQGRAAVAYH